MIELTTLRPAQSQILAYREGTLAISAVPGAGKTFILTHLAATLIDELGVKPSEVLILTYMRSAASTFKRRIAKALQDRGRTAYGLQAMTIHAFCLSVVKQAYARHGDDDDGLNVLGDAEKVRILMDGLDVYLRNPKAQADWKRRYGDAEGDEFNDPRQLTYKAATKVIGAAKNFRLSPEQVDDALADRQPELAHLYRFYQQQLLSLHAMDYEDLVQQAIALLRDDADLLAYYHRRFRYVMEDEAQDSTPAQNELITLLTDPERGGSGNLVRVGDSNQAIMTSFTFNDPRFFREFCDAEAARNRHVPMDESSRSAREVLTLANRLQAFVAAQHGDLEVGRAFKRLEIQTATAGKANPACTCPPTWTVYPKKEEEQLGVLSRVRDYLRLNPGCRAAILVFSNNQQKEYRDKAHLMGIPLYEEERRTGGTKPCLELLKQALVFLSLPEERQSTLFLTLLEARARIEQEAWHDLKAVRKYLKDANLEDLMYPATGLPPARPAALAESDYAAVLYLADALRRLLDARHLPPSELLPTMAQALMSDAMAPVIAAKAATIILRHVLPGEDPHLAMSIELDKLMAASQGKELVAMASDLSPPQPGELEVLTLHKSKGAEYDAVWLPCLGNYFADKTFFPWDLDQVEIRDREAFLAEQALIAHNQPKAPTLAEAELAARRLLIAERLRLLYVGITRAEKELHLSTYGEKAPPHILDLASLCDRRSP
jgi:DNA helicase-2/ATP-dependent DNA helicase PcrA